MREQERGSQWDLTNHLEDLDFTDDICLLSQIYNGIEGKLKDLRKEVTGLKLNASKTKLMQINTKGHKVLRIQKENVEEIVEFP